MKLLYRTAEWHGFAKLRMHTETTLTRLDELTREFGLLMRQFRDITCTQFETYELPREIEARKRQCERAQAASSLRAVPASPPTAVPTAMISDPVILPSSRPIIPQPIEEQPARESNTRSSNSARKPKKLNLFTYKFHSLGDYVQIIRMFGASDSYSTQVVSTFSFGI